MFGSFASRWTRFNRRLILSSKITTCVILLIFQVIKDSPAVVGMTTDMWTDNHRRRSYSTYTLHFITSEFKLRSVTLKTNIFTADHTGENIRSELLAIHKQFELESKKVIYVTDQGANIVKGCRIANQERYGCVAHGLHNLIVRDGIAKIPDLQHTIDKAKEVNCILIIPFSIIQEQRLISFACML